MSRVHKRSFRLSDEEMTSLQELSQEPSLGVKGKGGRNINALLRDIASGRIVLVERGEWENRLRDTEELVDMAVKLVEEEENGTE